MTDTLAARFAAVRARVDRACEAAGRDPAEVLDLLAHTLTNKLLHAPSVQLKKLSAEGRLDALALAQELFALDEGERKS